jgi:ketosteroid isomerase-like protein
VTLRAVELARQGLKTYGEGGPEAFVDYLQGEDALDADFVFHVQEDLPNGGDWRGIEGFMEMSRIWLEPWEEFRIDPHEFVEVSEEALLVPVRQEGVAKGSGIEIGAEMFYVMRFREGRLSQVRLYTERELAERAAAARP